MGTMPQRGLFLAIRWRLVAWTMVILALILMLLGTSIYVTLAQSLTEQVDRNLAAQSDPGQIFPFLFGRGDQQPGNHEGYRGGVFYLAIDSSGQVRANPQQVQIDANTTWPTPQERAIVFQTIELNGESTRVAVRDTTDGGALIVGQSLAPDEGALNLLLLVLLGGGGLGMVLSLGGAWFLAGRALLPIQQAFQRQQEFVADASHELRTPLTVLRSATDLLNRHRDHNLNQQSERFEDVRAEIGRMERLAQDLLTVARSDRGELELMTAEVDLARVAGDVVRRMRPVADSRHVRLELDATPALVEVDPDRLQQVAFILVDSAIKYTPSDGKVEVRVGSDGNAALLEVRDTGPRISPEHLPIAKLLVEAHGGELTLSSQAGHGTTARVRLPATNTHLSKLQGSISTVIATS